MPEPAVNSSGLFQTPPIPEDLPKIELTENSRQVLAKRYLRRGNDGNPVESIDEMFWRVAWHVADVPEREHNQEALAEAFYRMMASKSFFPTHRPSPVRAHLLGSWLRVSCCQFQMTWDVHRMGFSAPSATPH